jgi:hypothetical protein
MAGTYIHGLLPKSPFTDYYEAYDVFSEMPGGPRRARPSRRPSSFQGVTEWGTPWLRSEGAENSGGGRLARLRRASPVRNALK